MKQSVVGSQLPCVKEKDSAYDYTLSCTRESVPPLYIYIYIIVVQVTFVFGLFVYLLYHY